MTATNKSLADAKTRLVCPPCFQREVGGEGLTAQLNEGTRGKTGACNKHSLVNDKIAKKLATTQTCPNWQKKLCSVVLTTSAVHCDDDDDSGVALNCCENLQVLKVSRSQ